jgi:hypothetical protein
MAWVPEFERIWKELKALAKGNDVLGITEKWEGLWSNSVHNSVLDEIKCFHRRKGKLPRRADKWLDGESFFIFINEFPEETQAF